MAARARRGLLAHGVDCYFQARSSVGRDIFRVLRVGAVTGATRITNFHKLGIGNGVRALAALDSTRLVAVASGLDRNHLVAMKRAVGSERIVADLGPRSGCSGIVTLTAAKRVVFGTNSGLWASDGSASGTRRLVERRVYSVVRDRSSARAFVLTAGKTSQELWVTDGTTAGTQRVQLGFLGARAMTACGPGVVFAATDARRGVELWSSDGTLQGTKALPEIRPGPRDGFIGKEAWAYGGRAYFIGEVADDNLQVYSTDGKTVLRESSFPLSALRRDRLPEIHLVRATLHLPLGQSFNFGLASFDLVSRKFGQSPVGGARRAYAGRAGTLDYMNSKNELWTSDGSAAGTKKIATFPRPFPQIEVTPLWARAPGDYLFRDYAAAGDRELGIVDTRSARVQRIDLDPGMTTANADVRRAFEYDERAYFTVRVPGVQYGIWSTDGTGARFEFSLADVSAAVALDDRVVFAARELPTSRRRTGLWSLSKRGLEFVQRYTGELPIHAKCAGNELLYAVHDGLSSLEIWASSGTSASTRRLARLSGSGSRELSFGVLDGTRDFVILTGRALYHYQNGTAKWIALASASGTSGNDLVPTSSGFVCALAGELYITKGLRSSGFALLKKILPGSQASRPEDFVGAGGLVFFSATGAAGRELWRSDGTAAGTRRVVDLVPGPESSNPSNLVRIGAREILFDAVVPPHGRALFRSDGTASGTKLVHVIDPTRNSFARLVSHVGDTVYLMADDGKHGSELHRLKSIAKAETVARGCSGALFRDLAADAPRLGRSQRIESQELGVASVPRALLVGVAMQTPLAVAGCRLSIDPGISFFIADAWVSQSKARTSQLAIPTSRSYLGISFGMQVVSLSSALPGGLSFSRGLECVIGY